MLRFVVRSLIVVTLLLCSGIMSAQNFQLRHFTEDDGLPSNTVYSIYRDSKNSLWICTDKGVARYNGIKFEKFTTFNGLADNEVFCAKEDLEGRLWFNCYNGQLCYYQNDSFHNPTNTPFLKQPYKTSRTVRTIIQPDSSVLFVFATPGYFCYVKNNKCVTVKVPQLENNIHFIGYIKKINDNVYRFIADQYSWDVKISPTTTIIDSQKNLVHIRSIRPYTSDQSFYFFCDSGFYTQDSKLLAKLPPNFLKTAYPISAYLSKNGTWLYGTDRGLFIEDGTNIFPEKTVSSIDQDNKDNYWISTLKDGIYSFSKSFRQSDVAIAAYSGPILFSKEINGQLLFSIDGYLLYTLRNNKPVLLFDTHKFISDASIKRYAPIWNKWYTPTWYIDSNLSAYFFTYGNALSISNILAEQPQVHKLYYNLKLIRSSLKKIVKVGSKLYMNAGFSVHEMDMAHLADKDSIRYLTLLDKKSERVYDIAASPDNAIWQSTIDKVYRAKDGRNTTPPSLNGLSFKHMTFIGKYLVGSTHDNQLLVCSELNGTTKIDTIIQETVWNELYSLDDNHALITTNSLNYILTVDQNGKNPPFATAIEDPFVPIRPESICVGDSICYFFKNQSITRIPTVQLLKVADAPDLYFTRLRSVKNSYPIQSSIELPYNEAANLVIGFSIVSFIGKDITYQYSISDKTDAADHWVNFKGDLNLANRRYGTYVVKVRAKTVSSAFSTPIQFNLTILRPFWATWWFITIAAGTLSMIIWMVVRWRIRISVARKEKEHDNHMRFVKSEYKAMNALMNPHFIFNALNNVQSLVNNNETLNATEYLGIFADLIRQNMNNISNETISLQKEINLVENYLLLEKLRFEDQLNYSINIADSIFPADIMVPPLMIQPLVENSIKHGILPLKRHGKQGIVHINIYEQNDNLLIEVKDNGIGVTKARQKQSLHKSYGLENLKSRIQQLSIIQGKEMSFELTETPNSDGTNDWTTATITMPLS